MTSQRKILANRRNAKKSTGPKSAEGKRTSSQNAYKHGIWANQLPIFDDERDEFEKLVADLGALLKPEGPILQYYFDEVVLCMWRLRMLVAIEYRQSLPLRFELHPNDKIPATNDHIPSAGEGSVKTKAQSAADRQNPSKQQEQQKTTVEVSGATARDLATQTDLLEQLRTQVKEQSLQVGDFRPRLSAAFGQDFVMLVDKFYPHQKSMGRALGRVMKRRGTDFGLPGLIEAGEKEDRDPIPDQSDGITEDIAARQQDRELAEKKKMLFMIIDQKMDQIRLQQLQQNVTSEKTDSVVTRFDLQLRYRAALTRDLRKAIESFLLFRSTLRPPKKK